MLDHIVNHHPIGFEGTKPVFDIALLEHCQGAENETGRFHLQLHDPGEEEAHQALLTLDRDEAQHSSGETEGSGFPPLVAVDVVGRGPAVNSCIPAHSAGSSTRIPLQG